MMDVNLVYLLVSQLINHCGLLDIRDIERKKESDNEIFWLSYRCIEDGLLSLCLSQVLPDEWSDSEDQVDVYTLIER